VRRRHAVLLGPVLSLVAAAPAAAAEHTVRGLDSLTWDRPDITVALGDTVHWRFEGTGLPHDITSSGSNWNPPYKSAGGPPPSAPGVYTFNTPGIYSYLCSIHPETMVGRVTVNDASGAPPPPPPPPPPSEQEYSNTSEAPTVFERGGRDRKRPRLRGLRVGRMAGGTLVRFRVSERSRVTVRLKRGGRTRLRKRVSAAGRETVWLRSRHLRSGRYRIVVRAADLAGNRSRARSLRVRLRY
jgi:plastocyanin